jgi:CubicO group peptidase (beta-lactamase class C family)
MAHTRLLTLLLTTVATAQPAADRYTATIEPALTRILRDQGITGLAIGIVEDGRLVYSHGFGLMNIGEPNRPITPETLFHMASITKLFVATSVMQLWEQGRVDLDKPITTYVPYFKLNDPRYRAITVRLMLSHISGMPDVEDYEWNKPQYDDGALERYVRGLSGLKLKSDPGTTFAYSNMAYEVLGDLIAKVSGVSFDDYVAEHILKPLGMSSSTLLFKQADAAKLAAGHRKKGGTVTVVEHYPYNRAHSPSSNLHSNVVDMARWAIANLNRGELDGRRILKGSTYDLMWKPVSQRTPTTSVGISWFLSEIDGNKCVMHNGGDDGFLSRLVLFPELKRAVVYMTNCDFAKLQPIDAAVMETVLAAH